MSRLIAIFLFCLGLPLLAQTTWYVDKSNPNAGTGTASDPFSHLSETELLLADGCWKGNSYRFILTLSH